MVWMVFTLAHARPTATELTVVGPTEGLCPGEVRALEVTAVDERGRARRVRPRDLAFDWAIGEVSDSGELTGPADPRAAWGSDGKLTLTLAEDPSVRAELAVPLRYDCSVTVPARGRDGGIGATGAAGPASSSRGGNGQTGHDGERGGDAPEVHVRATLVREPRLERDLLQLEVQILGEEAVRYVAIDPEAGELVVSAVGGRGGQGGFGGEGGDVMEGLSGSGGNGGTGGRGGRGGLVVVFVDPTADGLLRNIVIENAGGEGGAAGPPGRAGNAGTAKDAADRVGRPGRPGAPGPRGEAGPPPEVVRAEIGTLWP